MDDLKHVIKLLEEQKETLSRIEKSLGLPKVVDDESKPAIELQRKKKHPKTIHDFVDLLKEEGFFDTPKTLKEVNSELTKNGHYFPIGTLSKSMLRLVRQRVVGRIGVSGKWAYVKR